MSPPRAPRRSFREHLQAELARRCVANDRYSLRAFARFLGVDHATLSQVLRGKRALTPASARRLGARLDLPASLMENLSLEEDARSPGVPRSPDVASVRELTDSAVGTLTNWHDWAILELTRLEAFVPDARWVARVLDCTIDEVELALHRLTSLGFLEMAAQGRWVDRSGHVETTEDYALAAVERLAERLRDLSVRALQRPDGRVGTHSTTTLAVSSAALQRTIARIDQLRAELTGALEEDAGRDAVYCLAISFFPITTPDLLGPQPSGE